MIQCLACCLPPKEEAEAIIFDKADEAEAKETLQYEREQTTVKLDELKKARRACEDDQERARIDAQIEEADRRLDEIGHELDQAETPDGEDERQ